MSYAVPLMSLLHIPLPYDHEILFSQSSAIVLNVYPKVVQIYTDIDNCCFGIDGVMNLVIMHINKLLLSVSWKLQVLRRK